MRPPKSFLIIAAMTAVFQTSVAAMIEGKVIGIADGDTLTILHDREQVRIRLTEIDAPEKRQPFGKASKQSLSSMCFGRSARVEQTGLDRYGRTLGRVECAGIDANAAQIERGMAWVYDRYVTDRSLYARQDAARASRRGLWSERSPVQPWIWRHERKRGRHSPRIADAPL